MDFDTICYKIYCFFVSPDNPKYWARRRRYIHGQLWKKTQRMSMVCSDVKRIRVDYEQEYQVKNYDHNPLYTRSPYNTNFNEYGNFERTNITSSSFFELRNDTDRVATGWGKDDFYLEKVDDFLYCHVKCANPTCIGDGFYLDDIILKAIKSKKTIEEGEMRCEAADNHYKDKACGSLLKYKITIEYHQDNKE